MFTIDDELKEFCESGVSVIVGVVDSLGRPRVGNAWGPRVHPGGARLSLYVETARAPALLDGRESNSMMAATFTDPVSARSIQVKGRILEVGDPNEAEQAWIERHRDAMTVSCALIGDPPHIIRNLWTDPSVRVDVAVERAFDQTPGPQAGRPL